jgi:hypothetical protein
MEWFRLWNIHEKARPLLHHLSRTGLHSWVPEPISMSGVVEELTKARNPSCIEPHHQQNIFKRDFSTFIANKNKI